jgi:hypothetical protein
MAYPIIAEAALAAHPVNHPVSQRRARPFRIPLR